MGTLSGKKYDASVFGEEPLVDPNILYTTNQQAGFYNWYNYMHDHTDAKKWTKAFCKEQKVYQKYLTAIEAVSLDQISTTLGWICRLADRGMKLDASQKAFMKEKLDMYVDIASRTPVLVDTSDKEDVPKVSIQERVKNKANDLIGELEGFLDDFYLNGYKFNGDLYTEMSKLGIKGAHCKYISKYFQPLIKELKTAEKNHKKDNDISEGYSDVGIRDLRKLLAFVEEIVATSLTMEGNAKKSRKPRQKKAKSAKKQIEKLKYMQKYDELQLVSESAEKLIGAKAAFIYNTTNNQLTLYVAETSDGLSVARSSLKDYKVGVSATKRFGKHIDKMKSFDKETRADAIKIFEKVKGQSKPATGRINDKMIIVKVY